MKYCPNCGAEYRPDAVECSDCLVPLVDEPPDELPRSEDVGSDLVVVYESSSTVDADVVRSLLEGDGIQAMVFRSGMAAYLGGQGPLSGGRVMVREEDRERALELIKVADHGDLDLGTDDPAPGRAWLYGVILAAIALGLVILILTTGQDLY